MNWIWVVNRHEIHRRHAMIGLSLLLAGCGGARPVGGGAWAAVENPAFDAWLRRFDAGAIPAAQAARILSQARYIPAVIERDRNQTEVKRSLEDYLAIAASQERIVMGRARYAALAGPFSAIEARYGVEGHVVAAVWGLESFYGTRMGEVPVISALATLAFDGRRGAFFRRQLIAAMQILRAGDIVQSRMLGSWAGAMGHTQFIPTSYLEYAVDHNGDGRRDIWGDDPTDALASSASYLARAGWQAGLPWGQEVTVPAGVAAGRRDTRAWADLGLRAADGGALSGWGQAQLLRTPGPDLLLYANYNVILRYNNAQSYAIGIGHLSDRLRGAGPFATQFGPDAAGMLLGDRIELQQRLTAAGFDTGGVDGVIGARSHAAITAYQSAQGLGVTGQASLDLLAHLR